MSKLTSSVANPCTGAAVFSLGGAATTAIGAAIRDHNVHNEAITVLAGGAITGAIAGLIGCCCIGATNNDTRTCLKFTAAIVATSLSVAALLTAPLMGEKCLDLNTNWGDTVVDGLIGSAVLVGGSLALSGVLCCAKGGLSLFSKALNKKQTAELSAANPQEQPGMKV